MQLDALIMTLGMFCAHHAQAHQVANNHLATAPTNMGKVLTCPRCRRAQPPGPRKRPAAPIAVPQIDP
ncbi:MAG: hypothetical protein LLF94_09465 [Chlamydiales bacterium]|nr:hypothetical protein [Chlamydiales bacterium]